MEKTEKRFALDTNFLLDLASGEDFALTLLEEFQGAGYQFGCPPVVLMELGFLLQREGTEEARLAGVALDSLGKWEIAFWMMKPVGDDVAESFQCKLVECGLLPESEVNDGVILAQTSLAGIPVLITSDRHLLDIDPEKLKQLFEERDLEPVQVIRAKSLARIRVSR